MKKLLLFIGCILTLQVRAQITTFPYHEDFESGTGSWQVSGDNSSWEWGTPDNTKIKAAGSGTNAWVTGLTGSYHADELSYLVSPEFDFSSLSADPVLSFLMIRDIEEAYDRAWVEFSTDGGSNWSKLDQSSGNSIYNNTERMVWDGSAYNQWTEVMVTLSGMAGTSSVRFRFVMDSDNVFNQEGIGIDAVSIAGGGDDLRIVNEASFPQISCQLSEIEEISLKVTNQGTKEAQNVQLCYQVNGGAAVCETYPGVIAVNEQLDYVFNQRADLSTPGSYQITLYSVWAEDQNQSNDTLRFSTMVAPYTGQYPYEEDFETGEGYWASYGDNSSWAYATQEDAAGELTQVWQNGSEGSYRESERSYLESPCFNFSGMVQNPVLTFQLKFQTEETFDGLWLEVSVDEGQSWNKISANATSVNWYNNTTKNWWDGLSGLQGEWLPVSTELQGYLGQASVKFRFTFSSDDTNVSKGIALDDFKLNVENFLSLGPDQHACSSLSMLLDAGDFGSAGNFSYLWSTGATTRTLAYERLTPGIDTVWVKVDDGVQSASDTIVLSVSQLSAQAQSLENRACGELSVAASADYSFEGWTPESDLLSYDWLLNGEQVASQQLDYAYTKSTAGIDTLIFEVSSPVSRCVARDTTFLYVQHVTAGFSEEIVSINSNEALTLSPVIQTAIADTSLQYVWYKNGELEEESGAHYVYSTAQTGIDTLVFSVQSVDYGCQASDTLFLIRDSLQVNFNSQYVNACERLVADFKPQAGYEYLQEDHTLAYTWTVSGEGTRFSFTSNEAVYHYERHQAGTDTLIVEASSQLSQQEASDTLIIRISPKLSVNLIAESQTGTGDVLKIEAIGNAEEYAWSCTGANPAQLTGAGPHLLTFASPGIYEITLEARNRGCTEVMTHSVEVRDILTAASEIGPGKFELYPNPSEGDFRLKLPQMQDLYVKVTDMKGRTLYEEMNITDEGTIVFNLKDRLSPGLYILFLETETMQKSLRFEVK